MIETNRKSEIGVGAVVLNDLNECLLLKRAMEPERTYWTIPGGNLNVGEYTQGAVKREILEEVGVRIEILRSLQPIEHFSDDGRSHRISFPFLVKIANDVPKNKEPDNHSEIKWFPIDNLPNNLTSLTRKTFEDYFKEIREGNARKEIKAYNALYVIFPDLCRYTQRIHEYLDVVENNDWHTHQTVYDHTVGALRYANEILDGENPNLLGNKDGQELTRYICSFVDEKFKRPTRKDLLMLALLFHDAGKKNTISIKNDGSTECPNHPVESLRIFSLFASQFELLKEEKEYVQLLIENHHYPDHLYEVSVDDPSSFEDVWKTFKENHANVYLDLLLLFLADNAGCKAKNEIKGMINGADQFFIDLLLRCLSDIQEGTERI